MMFEKLEKITKLPKDKLIKLVMIIAVIALFGILLSESTGDKKNGATNAQQSFEAQSAEESIEKRLQKILAQIDGVGAVKVMVTFESSEENVYSADVETSSQSDEQGQSQSEKKKLLTVDNSGESPVVEKQIQPQIRGVIVVCEGADNVTVKEAVTDAVKAGLGVSLSNISVVRGGKNG